LAIGSWQNCQLLFANCQLLIGLLLKINLQLTFQKNTILVSSDLMSATRPYVLSIAGFDPSGGAGLLADIKTFEAHNVQGLGVCSALTFQNERDFLDTKWIDPCEILMQIDVLFKLYRINWAKIGLIENLDILDRIIDHLKSYNAGIDIIWDPILKATAGFVFHDKIPKEKLFEICKKIYLITPNFSEIRELLPGIKQEAGANILSNYCKVLIKGGHKKMVFLQIYCIMQTIAMKSLKQSELKRIPNMERVVYILQLYWPILQMEKFWQDHVMKLSCT